MPRVRKSVKNQKDPQNRCKYALEGTLASSHDNRDRFQFQVHRPKF